MPQYPRARYVFGFHTFRTVRTAVPFGEQPTQKSEVLCPQNGTTLSPTPTSQKKKTKRTENCDRMRFIEGSNNSLYSAVAFGHNFHCWNLTTTLGVRRDLKIGTWYVQLVLTVLLQEDVLHVHCCVYSIHEYAYTSRKPVVDSAVELFRDRVRRSVGIPTVPAAATGVGACPVEQTNAREGTRRRARPTRKQSVYLKNILPYSSSGYFETM